MQDLIERSDAIKMVRHISMELVDADTRQKLIEAIPAVEPKRGEWLEWIDCEGEVFWKCSACGQVSEASVAGILYKFCPFCGADMREKDDE